MAGTGDITIPKDNRLIGLEVGGIVTANGIAQVQYKTEMPTSHITVTSTTLANASMTCSITPAFSNSIIKVEYFSTMALGSSNALILVLYRKIGSGSYTTLTPFTNAASRYQYGWAYNNSNWHSLINYYYDSPNTTEEVTYQLGYRNLSSTATNYLVHQYMEHGWVLTELVR
jgi:hypothetical protein